VLTLTALSRGPEITWLRHAADAFATVGDNQNAKPTVLRTAPSGRTLYTICTQPLRHIDPR